MRDNEVSEKSEKGALSANSSSLAVLQSEGGKRVRGCRFEAGGGRQNVKVQSWESLETRKNEL